jgi:hypothetical protein
VLDAAAEKQECSGRNLTRALGGKVLPEIHRQTLVQQRSSQAGSGGVHSPGKGRSGGDAKRRMQLLVGLQDRSPHCRLGLMERQLLGPGGFVNQPKAGGRVQAARRLQQSVQLLQLERHAWMG